MNLSPISYQVRRRLRMTRQLGDVATEIVTLCPAETVDRPPAYFLPDQLERVRGYPALSAPAAQIARIAEGEVTHSATRAYRLDRAALLGGYVFAGGTRHQMVMDRSPRGKRSPKVHKRDVALVGTPISDIYFGHYLMDDSATTLMAQQFGTVLAPRSRNRTGWTHAHDYRRFMGLEVAELGDTLLQNAWLFDDLGMNSHRRQRMHAVRDRLRQPSPARQGHGVFILRGSSGQLPRVLQNEAQLAESLSQRGFEVIDPMRESAAAIIDRLSGAALAISVEGSALTHAYLTMQDRGAMLTIQPPHRFDNVWKDFTDLLDMRYGFVVAEGDQSGFRLDLDDLLRTIDLTIG